MLTDIRAGIGTAVANAEIEKHVAFRYRLGNRSFPGLESAVREWGQQVGSKDRPPSDD